MELQEVGGKFLPESLSGFISQAELHMSSQYFLVCTHLGSKEAVETYVVRPAAMRAQNWVDTSMHAFMSPSLLGTPTPVSQKHLPGCITPNTILWVLASREQARPGFSKVNKSR